MLALGLRRTFGRTTLALLDGWALPLALVASNGRIGFQFKRIVVAPAFGVRTQRSFRVFRTHAHKLDESVKSDTAAGGDGNGGNFRHWTDRQIEQIGVGGAGGKWIPSSSSSSSSPKPCV